MDERAQIQEDLAQLAGGMAHRGANTLSEQRAARYLQRRLEEFAPYTQIDAFHATDSPLVMLAAFYGEFVFVAVIGHWVPIFAFAYGAVVFMFYLAEHTGYSTVSRFFPQYETQNVIARLPAERPRGRIVVTAHYDSARKGLLTSSVIEKYARTVHFGLVASMFLVLAGCALNAAANDDGAMAFWGTVLRWSAAGALGASALALLLSELSAAGDESEYARGANDNASGVAALLALAGRLSQAPAQGCDVWLVATGSSAFWRAGMRRLLRDPELTSQPLWFINIDRVGVGETALVTGEGLLYPYRTRRDALRLLEGDRRLAGLSRTFNAGYPTDLLLPLVRSHPAVGITSLPPGADGPGSECDRPYDVRPESVVAACDAAEALVRIADAWLPTRPAM